MKRQCGFGLSRKVRCFRGLIVGIFAENTELARIVSASIKTARTRRTLSRSDEN